MRIFRTHYMHSRLLWVSNIFSRSLVCVIVGGFFLFGFFMIVRREVMIMGAVSWSMVVGALIALFFLTPTKVVYWWVNLNDILRALVASILVYVGTVAIGYMSALRNWRAFWELLTFTGGASPSAVHAVALSGAVYFWFLQRSYAPSPHDVHIRGAWLVSHAEALQIAEAECVAKKDDSLLWGVLPIPISRGTEHFVIVGASGSGKTISLRLFLQTLVTTIRPGTNRRLLINDAKRDMFPILGAMDLHCDVRSVNPFDARGYAWDIAKDLDDDPRLPIELASILVPLEGESKPFFTRAAQGLLGGIMETFQRLTSENEGPRWTLRDVVLATRTKTNSEIILRAVENSDALAYLADLYLGKNETDRSIAATVENALRRLSYIAGAWEHAREQKRVISLRDWCTDESILLLGSDPEGETILKQINGIIFKRLTQIILGQSEANTTSPQRQTWFVIDELRYAGRLDGLAELCTFGRSKGACVVLGFQDMGGLEHTYGKDGEKLAHEIFGACENKAFLRTTDSKTQQLASTQFGEEVVDIPRPSTNSGVSHGPGGTTTSSGSSFSYQRERRPLILPVQFATDLPRPDPALEVGISGFYQSSIASSGYNATLESAVISKTLMGLSEDPAFSAHQKRPPSAYDIKPWTMEDLKRLHLEKFPQLLSHKTSPSPTPPPIPPSPDVDWKGTQRT